jgi:hypothetical protein
MPIMPSEQNLPATMNEGRSLQQIPADPLQQRLSQEVGDEEQAVLSLPK